MSRRTAAADKAIRMKWQQEQQLVLEGKGTRDWTEEQQKDILDPEKGKAYDDSGRAFEGQHMKSVEKYPEFQGDPDNIQFLTKSEHLEAHQGNWHNPTNWYFDPDTKQFFDFGDEKYVSCPITELSTPIYPPHLFDKSDKNEGKDENTPIFKQDTPAIQESGATNTFKSDSGTTPVKKGSLPRSEKVSLFKRIGGEIRSGVSKSFSFIAEHKEEIGLITTAVVIPAAKEVYRLCTRKANNSSKETNDNSCSDDSNISPDSKPDYDNFYAPEISSSHEDVKEADESDGTPGTPKKPHHRKKYLGKRWKKNENGELELTETWISETDVHGDQMNNESE